MLERLAEFSGNKGPIQQFAIMQAADMLVAAGVQFPESRGLKTPVLPEGAMLLPSIPADEGLSNQKMEELSASTRGIEVSDSAKGILRRAEVSKTPQAGELMALDSQSMGLPEYPTTKQAWEKSAEFGDKISAERFLLLAVEAAKGKIQVEIGKPLVAIMEPVADSDGHPRVLYLRRHKDGLWLHGSFANPGLQWNPGVQFVVSSRPPIGEASK